MSAAAYSEYASAVAGRLEKALGDRSDAIPLHAPEFSGNEWKYVKDCLDAGWVSSVGPYVDRFEADLARFTGAPHAVVTVNGTAALHVACLLSGVAAGDEVLMPSLTFIATANAVAYCSAIPHFVDVNEATLGVDAKKLTAHLERESELRGGVCFNHKTGRPIRALIVMHTFGHAADMENILAVCDRFSIKVIEDAAEAIGSYRGGRHLGTFAPIGTLSFNGNKALTTGGGGALLFQDASMAKFAKHLTTTAKVPHAWEFVHDQVGFNYRMPNINAALGCAQLEQMPDFLRRKRKLAEMYFAAFEGFEGVKVFHEPLGARSNYWLNALVLEPGYAPARDEILRKTNALGLMTRPVWRLMSELEMYRSGPKADLSSSKSLESRIINIPSSPILAGTSGVVR
jgi:perosamine synthetase